MCLKNGSIYIVPKTYINIYYLLEYINGPSNKAFKMIFYGNKEAISNSEIENLFAMGSREHSRVKLHYMRPLSTGMRERNA